MPVFLKLCLAHLIADFILQFEELYQLKLKSLLGHILHALCHAAISLLLLWPYLGNPFIWVLVLSLSAIHLFQDLIKYRLADRHRKYFFIIFMLDQALHFMIISSALWFPECRQVLGFASWPVMNELYMNARWTLYAIAFVTATFAGSFTLHALRTNFLPDSRLNHFITSWEMVHGILERSVLTWLFIFVPNPWVLVFSPLVGLVRLFFKRIRNRNDFLFSFDYAALIGLVFRIFILK